MLTYGTGIDAELEHWHYDTFVAKAKSVTVGQLITTFALGPDGKVKTIDLTGLGTFERKPEPVTATQAGRGRPPE